MDNSERLGPVLKGWFKQWDWPQSVTEGVARAKGWENGPWASQISICMSGRLTPKPAFFEALGEFNRVVAERDFAGVTDRRLIDRYINHYRLSRTRYHHQHYYQKYIIHSLHRFHLKVYFVNSLPASCRTEVTDRLRELIGISLSMRAMAHHRQVHVLLSIMNP